LAWNEGIPKEVTVNTHIKTEDTMPDYPAMKPRGPGTPPLIRDTAADTNQQQTTK